ncbi:hypothetical protein LCGC14_2910910, partial [marine sediment metagenome]
LGTRSTTDLSEGSNLYYTNARADARIAAADLADIGNVTITSIASGEILKWNGSLWINNTLAEAGISAVGHTHDDRYYTETEISTSGQSNVHWDNITNEPSFLLNITGEPLSDLSDVTITSIASGEILKWSGSAWINNTLAEAGISAVGHTHTNITPADSTDASSFIAMFDSATGDQAIKTDGGLTYNATTGVLTATGLVLGSGNLDMGTNNITNVGTTTFNTVTYTWPGSDGGVDNVLTTNGSGALSWTAGGGGALGGSGTAGTISKWSAVSTLTDSFISENTSGGANIVVAGKINLSGVQVKFTSTGVINNILTSETNTGTGSLRIQAGGGSATYGGSVILYANAHATKPGDVFLGISSGSGGSFRFGNTGTDTGSDVFTISS